jgi:selenocysteine lyase/cysteine desulfurase
MYMKDSLNTELPFQGHFFNAANPAARFTPAGPDHAQIASVNGVVDYLEAFYTHHRGDDAPVGEKAGVVRDLFRDQESSLLRPLLDFLSGHPRVRLIGKDRVGSRAPTVAFTVDGQVSAELAKKLAGMDLGVGVGHFYAYRLIEALGIDTDDGVLRASFVHYTHPDEVARLVEGLDQLI